MSESTTSSTNPLLNTHHTLPPFSQIKPDLVLPAITTILDQNRKHIAALLNSTEYNWDSLITPLHALSDTLANAWSPVSHMNAVVNSDDLREAYNQVLPKITEYYTELGQNKALYEAINAIKNSDTFKTLSQAQQTSIEYSLRDFKLSGVALDDEKKQQFANLSLELSKLSTKFSENVLDATQGWTKLIEDKSELDGVPESALSLFAQTAQQREKKGYLLTLEFPSYLPIMQFCKNRQLRQEMYEAFVTRASEQGPQAGQWDNSQNMKDILEKRHELSKLLDFDNYAQYSIATKMAQTTDEVLNFLSDLAKKSQPQALEEYQELQDFAKDTGFSDELQAWDIPFYSEQLKQQRYSISDEELRPYFPITKVLPGLFDIAHKLFGVDITDAGEFDSWHTDAKLFNVSLSGQVIAQFYLDLYARPNKRGGAWMDDCRVRWRKSDGSLQIPVAYLVCNFTPPVGDQPALLTHNEVTTLFHEFGHGLHHMLTEVEIRDVSGINNVAWDAVELPSQFLENWCWDEDAIDLISGHYQSGETLPKDLLDKMLAAKNFQTAMFMVRQLEFALFDFRLHAEYTPDKALDEHFIQDILNTVRAEVSAYSPPSYNRFQHSFSHIFAGGYAAGYYSYKWAEVLSADAFSLFEEQGIFDQNTGRQFAQTILAKGGSEPAMNLFVAFRGRQPTIDALLRHSGIKAA